MHLNYKICNYLLRCIKRIKKHMVAFLSKIFIPEEIMIPKYVIPWFVLVSNMYLLFVLQNLKSSMHFLFQTSLRSQEFETPSAPNKRKVLKVESESSSGESPSKLVCFVFLFRNLVSVFGWTRHPSRDNCSEYFIFTEIRDWILEFLNLFDNQRDLFLLVWWHN